jgi:hypothetical protein
MKRLYILDNGDHEMFRWAMCLVQRWHRHQGSRGVCLSQVARGQLTRNSKSLGNTRPKSLRVNIIDLPTAFAQISKAMTVSTVI